MRSMMIAAGVAALAVSGALADPGGGKGGQGKGGGKSAEASQVQHGNAGKPDRGDGGGKRSQREGAGQASADRDRAQADRGENRGNGRPDNHPEIRGNARADGGGPGNNDRGDRFHPDQGRKFDDRADFRGNGRDIREVDGVRVVDGVRGRRHVEYVDFADGCPPGLAKKFNGCMPPGQAKKRYAFYDRSDWWGYPIDNERYFYRDGYLLRLGDRGLISGFVPLLGGALVPGSVWPAFYYQPVTLAPYQVGYYGLGPANSYRYADGVVYNVDPTTTAITSIAALLTGDTFRVGQPMPIGYQVYNVPYAYRDRYYDTPTAYYRYADGYVYQVNPETMLVASAIQLAL